jgi:NADH-quinone oxidoreductase subunit N
VPDTYTGVPMIVTAFYSIFVKFVLFSVFLQLASNFVLGPELEYIALLSILIGCYGTLKQQELKRFLAYSSITHVSFLLLGDSQSSFIYILSYVLGSLVFFFILLNLRINTKEFTYIADIRYLIAGISS